MCTALTLGDAITLSVYQIQAPILGYANHYLLHGLIAIAALHKATQVAEPCKYVRKAMESLNSGLPRLQSLVANMANESPHAITMYACFVGLYALGLPAVQSRPNNPLDDLVEAFKLIRGTATVITQTWLQVTHGPIGPLMQNGIFKNFDNDVFVIGGTGYKLELIARLADVYKLVDGRYLKTPVILLKRIAEWFLPDSGSPNTPFKQSSGMLLGWPASLSFEFLDAFRQRQREAVIVVAYYSLFMRKECWFHGDWRTWILSAMDELNLPEPWAAHLAWIHSITTLA